ncbi:quinone oxidoreductase [Paramyrothecium foliicola]|nr:quinone oxidoreductase [Paramyrothecium foliicola]
MYAAQVTSWTEPPVYTQVQELSEPSADQLQLRVLATAIHRLVRSRAAGQHYTSRVLLHLPGVDGVGQDVVTGKKYYFFALASGSFAEVVNVPKTAAWELPEGADAVTVAALVNPAMSSWMALAARTTELPNNFSVAVLGVTSASGRIAVHVARKFGASKVVGLARNATAMGKLGLDDTIVLSASTNWKNIGEVDVILDYVFGAQALELLQALPPSDKEVQFVQIGMVSGQEDIPVSASLLRSKRITIRGAGPGSWSMQEFAAEVPGMLNLVAVLERENDIVVRDLKDIAGVWIDKGLESKRVVFVPK